MIASLLPAAIIAIVIPLAFLLLVRRVDLYASATGRAPTD